VPTLGAALAEAEGQERVGVSIFDTSPCIVGVIAIPRAKRVPFDSVLEYKLDFHLAPAAGLSFRASRS